MNVLSLCAGIGGLDLGLKLACPDARTVGYVEWEPYAACVLAERMAEGRLDACPIYCDDLRRFDAKQWAGAVDLVAAGFPCQPFSVAGKQRGMSDERWLWPAVFNVIRDSGATSCFLENVPPIVGKGGTSVLADIASLGWSAEWGMFRASDVGAPHRRERWFLLALADSDDARQRAGRWAVRDERDDARGRRDGVGDAHGDTTVSAERAERLLAAELSGDEALADASGFSRSERHDAPSERRRSRDAEQAGLAGGNVANTGHGLVPLAGRGPQGRDGARPTGEALADASESGRREGLGRFAWPPGPNDRDGWERWLGASGPEPILRGDAARLPGRLDRLRCLGNAVVPRQAELAFHVLYERLMA